MEIKHKVLQFPRKFLGFTSTHNCIKSIMLNDYIISLNLVTYMLFDSQFEHQEPRTLRERCVTNKFTFKFSFSTHSWIKWIWGLFFKQNMFFARESRGNCSESVMQNSEP